MPRSLPRSASSMTNSMPPLAAARVPGEGRTPARRGGARSPSGLEFQCSFADPTKARSESGPHRQAREAALAGDDSGADPDGRARARAGRTSPLDSRAGETILAGERARRRRNRRDPLLARPRPPRRREGDVYPVGALAPGRTRPGDALRFRYPCSPARRRPAPLTLPRRDFSVRPVPTVKIIGPYRFHFFSGDRDEPRHIHVERDRATAKFWLDSVRLERSTGFSRTELARLQKLVERHALEFRRKWNDYFGTE